MPLCAARLPSRFALVPGLMLLAGSCAAGAPATAPDLTGRTDASIREVLRVVSRHQLRALKDGDYPAPITLKSALAASPPVGVGWNYPWGVTLYGALRSTDATGDREVENFALEHNRIAARDYVWLAGVHQKLSPAEWNEFLFDRSRIKVGGLLALGSLDSCGAMGAQMLEGILRHPEQETLEEKIAVARIANWIVHKQDRLPDGTLWRPTSRDEHEVWPDGTLWADDLYMACPFLVRWARYSGDGRHLTDAAQQVLNMAARLQDADGVWFHGYSVPRREHSPFKWGRGNGWVMVATAEVLSALPAGHPLHAPLLDLFRRHVAGVIRLQPAAGVWRQVLDHPQLWPETSCTAMFAYAIARGVNRGWLPAGDMTAARNAFAGLCANCITPDGAVKGTCQGTSIGFRLEYYADRPCPDDDLHGRGVVLLAGTEILAGQN